MIVNVFECNDNIGRIVYASYTRLVIISWIFRWKRKCCTSHNNEVTGFFSEKKTFRYTVSFMVFFFLYYESWIIVIIPSHRFWLSTTVDIYATFTLNRVEATS